MNIIFKSTVAAFSLGAFLLADSNAGRENLPSISDVVNNLDVYIKNKKFYSKIENKEYTLIKYKVIESSESPKETQAAVEWLPLSPKHSKFPWIGDYQTYTVQKADSKKIYFLTIAEVLKAKKN